MRTLAFVGLVLAARVAVAQDRFEIQVYDSETAAPDEPGFEMHLNDGSQSIAHATIEPHLGVARWAELGAYVQSAVLDGEYRFGGGKVRFKMRVPRKLAGMVGLAVNFELSSVPATFEANKYGSEIRPIVDLRAGPFYASANPIVDTDLGGALAGRPQLEPCVKAALFVVAWLAVGGEYYAALGPIDAPWPASQQVHQLYGAVDVDGRVGAAHVAVNAGFGVGLAAGERLVGKMILTLDFPR